MELPELFLDSMKALLGDEYDLWRQSLSRPVSRGVRFNPGKASKDEILCLSEMLSAAGSVPWCSEGYYIPQDVKASASPYYAAGLYYIQEPSAMAPAEILSSLSGDYVLDLCAAPGGKATRLGINAAFLLANDISAARARALVKNIELWGLCNAVVSAEAPEKLRDFYPCFFDKILVDAPCSGEGMFKKDPTLIRAWTERGPEYYHQIQKQILDSAFDMLRPGGYLLYSTCTFSELEDEGTVEAFLSEHQDMELIDIPGAQEYGFRKGKGSISAACRLYPFALSGEGHFLALMKKKGESLPRPERGYATVRHEDKLYRIFEDGAVYKKGLRYLKRGLCLGTYNRAGKFKPSQAAALALTKDDIVRGCAMVGELEVKVVDLEESDPRVLRYLKGETIEGDADGNVLICLKGHPLGFGRGSGGRIRNDLPAGYVRDL